MKKNLLLFCFFTTFVISAQVLESENFNGLTIGNVGTDYTGTSPGQGSCLTFSSNGTAPTTTTNASNANFQIVASGNTTSNGLLIQGPNGDKGSRYLWKDGLPAAWASRTVGNNIIEVEVDVNPGTRGTSRNRFGVEIYNADFSRTLAGFQVNSATGELYLVAYSTPAPDPVGNWIYPLAAAPGVLLPENTWSRVGISYNKTTGRASINTSVITGGSLGINGSSLNTDPVEIDFAVVSGHTTALPNTTNTTMIFDNFVVRASATDTLLGLESNQISENNISIFPNPSNGIFNIQPINNQVINKIEIIDLNGRIIKSIIGNETQINISEFSEGIYMMKIISDKGNVTKKIIKE